VTDPRDPAQPQPSASEPAEPASPRSTEFEPRAEPVPESTAESALPATESAPPAVEPAAPSVESAPSSEPAPSSAERAPSSVEPAPSSAEPAPASAEALDAQPGEIAAADQPLAADLPTARSAESDAPPATNAIVTMQGVTRKFDDRVVVKGIDLAIEPGTILGVIGPSGSGKTTTIRMLTGALRPTSGEIRVLGERPADYRRETRERIGYMPQLFTLYPDLTARENVDFVGSLFGMLWRRRRTRTKQVLQLLELWDARDRRASQMSGGMQRRLELACALVHEPTLLFLDEPTAGIDPILRAKVWDELHALRDAGRTLLVTTQYVGDAEDCDTVALIADGRLVALGHPDELRAEALGGNVIEVETAALFDATAIDTVPGVVRVDQQGPRQFTATVDDSAVAMPAVVDAVTAAGSEVVSAQEVRPSFDEVFAVLVERANAEEAARAAAQEQADARESAA
jgi:ABC-2 type transport system ATP-binding protein